jgi:hypothetical protein
MARKTDGEIVANSFADTSAPRAGVPPLNVSAADVRPGMEVARDDRGVDIQIDPEGFSLGHPGRTPELIDAATGQELAHRQALALRQAARYATGEPYLLPPDQLAARKATVIHSVIMGSPGIDTPAGHVGGGMVVGSPARLLSDLFGIGGGR